MASHIVFDNTQSGSCLANETLVQCGAHGLPFGGTGPSGCTSFLFLRYSDANVDDDFQLVTTSASTPLIRLPIYARRWTRPAGSTSLSVDVSLRIA